jgi:hypothetical protein
MQNIYSVRPRSTTVRKNALNYFANPAKAEHLDTVVREILEKNRAEAATTTIDLGRLPPADETAGEKETDKLPLERPKTKRSRTRNDASSRLRSDVSRARP